MILRWEYTIPMAVALIVAGLNTEYRLEAVIMGLAITVAMISLDYAAWFKRMME